MNNASFMYMQHADTHMAYTEKRRLERFNLKIPARVHALISDRTAEDFNLLTTNVSSGGAFFNTSDAPPVGTTLKIVLALPLKKSNTVPEGMRKVTVNLTGRVLRIEEKGIGVCFGEEFEMVPGGNSTES